MSTNSFCLKACLVRQRYINTNFLAEYFPAYLVSLFYALCILMLHIDPFEIIDRQVFYASLYYLFCVSFLYFPLPSFRSFKNYYACTYSLSYLEVTHPCFQYINCRQGFNLSKFNIDQHLYIPPGQYKLRTLSLPNSHTTGGVYFNSIFVKHHGTLFYAVKLFVTFFLFFKTHSYYPVEFRQSEVDPSVFPILFYSPSEFHENNIRSSFICMPLTLTLLFCVLFLPGNFF